MSDGTVELINDRLSTLKDSLSKLQNNANAHIGAIQELERLKKEVQDGISAGEKIGLNAGELQDDSKQR